MTKESPTKYNKPIFVFPFLRESKEGDTLIKKTFDASYNEITW
jgi:hypothetical protein